jgi:uncharacterized protein YndB with AHSA1/START domain
MTSKTTPKRQKMKMEFSMKSSPKILYPYLATPSGLADWFADDVTFKEGIYTFHWDGEESQAKMTHKRDNQMVRYKWINDPDDAYIEFEIQTDDLTSDVALMVTDFVKDGENEETERLWDSQVHQLKHILGS